MKRSLAALAVLALTLPAQAGPIADFDTAYDAAWANYRQALFATNSGDAAASAAARTALSDQWSALIEAWEATPPPQYADDPGFADTLEQVAWLINKSSGQIVEGDLHGAHVTLEGIRAELAALHERNHIETFSDRMNAYHGVMEQVLASDLTTLDAAGIDRVQEQAALLAFLAKDLLSAPPPAYWDNPEFGALSEAFQASVTAFQDAARSGDPRAIRAAAKGLKKPYAKLFLTFG